MITPLDIQTKKFGTSALGYKKTEVDTFMDELMYDYEKLYMKSNECDNRIKELEKIVATYKDMEETMKNTLVVAETSAEQLKKTAGREADSILKEAETKAKEIIEKANGEITKLTHDYESLKREISTFMTRSKAEFEIQIKSLDRTMGEIEKKSI